MKNSLKARSLAVVIAAALVLAGCVTPQSEEPRGTPIDGTAMGLAGTSIAPLAEDWWKAFNDPQLDTLIDASLQNSPSLAQAMARVRAAEAHDLQVGGGNKPQTAIDAEEIWQRFSANYYIPPPFGGRKFWVGQVEGNLNWNLDFWGRQSELIHQARSQKAATELDAASARLALGGAIAQAYVELYRSWEMIDIATRLQEQREQLLKLTQRRVSAGLDTQVEVKIAEAALPQARAARMQAESARDLAVHRLAELAGYGADRYEQIGRPRLMLDAALPLPDKLPIDLLGRRPDVLAARVRVDAATAGREAAHAAFYPDISLTAFAGMQAIGIDNLTDGGSLVYGIGPRLHLPIFQSQRLRSGYTNATAELDESVASYNSVVLSAVRETADQLSLGDSLNRQIVEVRQTLGAATIAYDLAQRRYGAGLTTQLVVLRAESQVLDARRDLVNARAGLVGSRVALLLMLGGSFDPATPAATSGSGAT